MAQQSITCPKCGAQIELTEAFTHQVEDKLRKEFNQKYLEEKSKLEVRVKKQTEDELGIELKDLRKQLEEKSAKLKHAEEQELELRKRQRELEEREKKISEEVRQKFDEQKSKLAEQVKKQAEEALAIELRDLKNQVNEKSNKLKQAQEQELELRKRQRELEEREQAAKVELERQLDEARKNLQAELSKQFDEKHRLKDAEKDKQISDMLRQIEELKRKAEQGSQQTQGEVLEIELENLLRSTFRNDDIQPVPKGIRGADVIQHVKTQLGNSCGTILWESKRTKSWSDTWLQKLKDDQREVKANVAVIVSTALPKEVAHVSNIDGIWIADFPSAIGLAMALRNGLIEVARAHVSMEGRNEKMEMVYNYLAGQTFRQRIEAVVESFNNMQDDLEAEKRAMEKIWAKRQQQIERIVKNTTRFYGDLQGIIGAALPPIARLELPAGTGDDEKS
jgi:hypothetical protein